MAFHKLKKILTDLDTTNSLRINFGYLPSYDFQCLQIDYLWFAMISH